MASSVGVVVANHGYLGAKPPNERVVVRFIPDAQTRLLALHAGKVDIVFPVPPLLLGSLPRDSGLDLVASPLSHYVVLTVNLRGEAPFDLLHDLKVRAGSGTEPGYDGGPLWLCNHARSLMSGFPFETDLSRLPGDHPQWYLDGYPLMYLPEFQVTRGPVAPEALDAQLLGADPIRLTHGYVHIPFCRSPCGFCSHHKYDHRNDRCGEYTEAVKTEMALAARLKSLRNVEVAGIGLGGGTPTVLSAKAIVDIVSTFRNLFPCSPDFSCSVEASTRTCGRDYFERLIQGGIQRISFGLQSFSSQHRKWLGLADTADKAVNKVMDARRAGFIHINIDMLYGFAGQSWDDLNHDLDMALSLNLESYTYYPLIIYPSSAIGQKGCSRKKRDDAPLPDAGAMLDFIAARMRKAGYLRFWLNHYLRSSQLRPRTALSMGNYLAFGSGAFGIIRGLNYFNEPHLPTYLKNIARGLLPQSCRTPMSEFHRAVRRFHYAFLQRTVNWEDFSATERELLQAFLVRFEALGFWEDTASGLRATNQGERFADAFLQALARSSIIWPTKLTSAGN